MFHIRPGKWEGLDGLGEGALREVMKRAERTIMQILVFAASEVKKTLTGTRTGRTYRVSKRGRLHIASAPGEPPAVLFGNLRNSVGHSKKPTWDGHAVSGEFGVGLGAKPRGGRQDPGTTYARILEYGGVANRSRIAPRPYLEPTVIRIDDQISQMMEQSI